MNFLINIAIDNFESSDNNLLLKYEKNRKQSFLRKRKWFLAEISKKRTVTKMIKVWKTIPLYHDDTYFTHFRLTCETFADLKNALESFWSKPHGEYSLEHSLHMTLWKLSNSRVTYRELADRFNVGQGTAHKLFLKTIKTICKLKNEICLPSVLQQKKIMENFQTSRLNSFPFVVGCLDGMHFKINTPQTDAISYYDRKGNFLVIMQAICDSKFFFLDVFIGYPGSCHDANVWKNSPLYKGITSGQIKLAKDAIILADSAYPVSRYLIALFRDNGHHSREEKQFNYYMSSTRVFIEQTFGIFRAKFKILNHIDMRNIEDISTVILACAILHNFILRSNPVHSEDNHTSMPENLENSNDHDMIELPENINDTNEGIVRRNNLKMLFIS
ncbi:uncharacterized protein LOC126766145 [Bactrocera neohumeralis]|uniref:uncharacterized protein LOC126766145 n=1 Tax=Bactrocera neohumeralis TaxID=98809 RepID=UPI002165D22F|nr:uncharacterized protein LOC126766145 [Bactrocera neohumeralis]